ncbi:MAG: SDR family NAD(P)-dependent oxidoreductase, partial [Acidobacteriota bacterium]|nr:SDR family NAD(P)-dependent oxidoreductase [Acidobacteriota bacterium]
MTETIAKIALITGANKGIGLETAKQLGKLGVTILVGSRDLARGEQAAEVLRGIGVDARALKLDVENPADRAAAAKYIEKEFGHLDILINNAGVMLDPRTGNATSITSPQILHETFETNFFSVIALTQTLLPLLHKSPAGRIVN